MDDVDGRRPPKVLHELRVVVDERTVSRPAALGDGVHDAGPTSLTRIRRVGEGGRERHRAHRLLERAHRDASQPVLGIDGLALFSHPVASPDRARRGTQNGARDSAAATADGAAAAVEKGEIDSGLFRGLDQPRLRAMQRPARRADPRVLVAVRVSDHHHLVHVPLGEVRPVVGLVEQCAHDVGRALEVGHGFEERRDVQRHVPRA